MGLVGGFSGTQVNFAAGRRWDARADFWDSSGGFGGTMQEGIALAKARGAYKGRVRSVTDEQINAVRKRVADGVPLTKAVKKQGISRATAYRYFKERDGK